jgi:hypothetical protein
MKIEGEQGEYRDLIKRTANVEKYSKKFTTEESKREFRNLADNVISEGRTHREEALKTPPPVENLDKFSRAQVK